MVCVAVCGKPSEVLCVHLLECLNSLIPRPRPAFRRDFCSRVGEPGNVSSVCL